MNGPVAIVAARRTPQGRFLGSLANLSSVDLASAAGAAVLEVLPDRELIGMIDRTIVGNVLGAGAGMNVARQVAVRLGLPVSSTAFTVNMMCASGMKAIHLGCQAVLAGEARMVLCGGTESMSQAPYLAPGARSGLKLGDAPLVDSILKDGLVDAFDRQHMGLSAERLAVEFGITRQAQDAFAAESQRRYASAVSQGHFLAEIVPMSAAAADEHPRPETTVASLAKLKPAFDPAGTVTAGNSSGINDGAAMTLLCTPQFARDHGLKPLAFIKSYAEAGCEPSRMGLGPVHATRRLFEGAGLTLDDFDTIELNESFAAQALACMKELGADHERTNRDGGSIALGHPIGASGARLIVHMAHAIAAGRASHALATLCVGGGMGVAARLTAE